MKKYTDKELAGIVNLKISDKFKNPNDILSAFNANIRRKFKSLCTRKPTDNEIDTGAMKFANQIHNDLRKISDELIISRISKEIADKNYYQGIELKEYLQYFEELAMDLVKELIQVKYNSIRKQIKKK